MKLEAQRREVLSRLVEARLTLDIIIELEAVPPAQDSPTVLGLRGLFFVHLYACLEFAVNHATQRVLTLISAYEIEYRHFSPRFHVVSMASGFMAIRDAGRGKKWGKRIEFVERIFSEDKCAVNAVVFSEELQNIWVKTISELFDCLGIDAPPLPDMTYAGHIDEIVDKRNAVAHGRKSASEVASGSRSPVLKRNWEIVSETIEHIFNTLSDYLDGYRFVAAPARAGYEAKHV
ncbi:hypothetical protein GR157_24495 [Burkholderia sp. 4701]|nr:hypothetical protein [Burkholderia sp. 4701]MXN85092.1 hypothetical protein [Burkholderia sp. 4812]